METIQYTVPCVRHTDEHGNTSLVPLLTRDDLTQLRRQFDEMCKLRDEAADSLSVDSDIDKGARKRSEDELRVLRDQCLAMHRRIGRAESILDTYGPGHERYVGLRFDLQDIDELLDMDADEAAVEGRDDGGEPTINLRKKRAFLLKRCVVGIPSELTEDEWRRNAPLRDSVFRYLSQRAWPSAEYL